ncbi:hypothetical protein B4135_0679 [Caldibacillus debilis]|uniref:Uncharacterized protein n=1 Tax=Caldibacillus debilis TaxID=301148 RepID=A0A150LKW5_9BACI|nr:hypothetical protein B4135_0679 [Caldibacillus debilis]
MKRTGVNTVHQLLKRRLSRAPILLSGRKKPLRPGKGPAKSKKIIGRFRRMENRDFLEDCS